MSDEFLELMSKVDPSTNFAADLLLDTNVMLEIYTIGDLLRIGDQLGSAESARRSPTYKYRQVRTRYSTILAWWLAKNRRCVGVLGNELVDQMAKLAPLPEPGEDGTSYAITTAIIHVVRELVLVRLGWRDGALTDVNHLEKGTKADSELLRIAIRDSLPLVTYEGYTERGFSDDPSKLRNRAKEAGVPVYTPREYLAGQGVDVVAECRQFIPACEKAVDEARNQGLFANIPALLDDIVPLYRMILLDEVDDSVAHIPSPPDPTV